MRRTMIVTLETEGENEYRQMEHLEEDVMTVLDAVANSSPCGCAVFYELCVVPLSSTLIDKLCNTTTEVSQ